MKNLSIVIMLSFTMLYQVNAQDCKVLLPSLKGTYKGKCKKGLAHGHGNAEGIDRYEGQFKKGLPNGYGVYTYSASGDIYKGSWKVGKQEGKGILYLKGNEKDQLIGFWKNDKYAGKTKPVAYKVTKKTSVARYTIKKTGEQNKVVFSIMRGGTVNSSVEDLLYTNSSGSYYQLSQYHGFNNVEFPFECSISYTTMNLTNMTKIDVRFEFKIYEQGAWEVKVYN